MKASLDEQPFNGVIAGFGIDPGSQLVVIEEILKLIGADYKGARCLDIDAGDII